MKKTLLLLLFGLIPALAVCPQANIITIINLPPISPFKALWEATCIVESSNNPNALNRLERAIGIAQIRMIRLKDYNQRTGKKYRLKDCYDPIISKEIWNYYASGFHYTQQEQIAKGWNGRGSSNKIYWAKIKKQLEKK